MAKESILTPDELAEFNADDFPFENIVFEGGGITGSADIGAVRVSLFLIYRIHVQ